MTRWIIRPSESWLWDGDRGKAAVGGYREAVMFEPCYVPPVLEWKSSLAVMMDEDEMLCLVGLLHY